jgi:nitroreductase
LRQPEKLQALSQLVMAPANVAHCRAAIAIATGAKGSFDVGRCVQNMALAAWNEGIGSSPNGVADPDGAKRLLGVSADESIVTIVSLGYPRRLWRPDAEDLEGILHRIDRKSPDELVVWVD